MATENSRKGELIEGHDYDGIQELNNGIPPVLSYIFFATLIFSVFYVVRYHIMDGPTQYDEYAKEVTTANEQNKQEGLTEITTWSDAEADIAEGKKAYATSCAACHGQAAEGTVGPNLVDKYWLYGGSFSEIMKILSDGSATGMMPGFKTQMSAKNLMQIASYVKSLEGTTPPNAKAAEGELVE